MNLQDVPGYDMVVRTVCVRFVNADCDDVSQEIRFIDNDYSDDNYDNSMEFYNFFDDSEWTFGAGYGCTLNAERLLAIAFFMKSLEYCRYDVRENKGVLNDTDN